MSIVAAILAAMVLTAAPIVIAATGELLAERVGVLNIGIDGVLLMGAVSGFATASATANPSLGMLVGAIVGGVFTLIFAIPVVFLGTDQILPAFALILAGGGLSAGLGAPLLSAVGPPRMDDIPIPGLSEIPVVGSALFDNPWPVYVAYLLPVAAWLLLNRTRHGLNMMAIGSDAVAADAAGIRVRGIRFAYVMIGGVLSGFGGAFLAIQVIGHWEDGLTAGRGFLAIAIVIFAGWRPIGLLVGGAVFGLLLALAQFGQALGWAVRPEILGMVPYVVTIAAILVLAYRQKRRTGGSSGPAELGHSFVRGSG